MPDPRSLLELGGIARQDLLEVLTAPRRRRAETIRQYWQEPDRRQFADALIRLEVDGEARAELIAVLREDQELTA